ncbi:cytosine permease [Candidatus Kirkpatrickella diaphorinae]|uniref:Cytosine permease n=1 Tax=Candidatus Kirkpatrickella diaphorinae TaxID=2984322 RepID=A0ABY6GIM5_9PROT|nr:cytosine permease [Candidatus Kirkpatrickella diaphorinae]UYH50695.1 cytosine permease [Candidatus Kirkpatrickella diaphorinae]
MTTSATVIVFGHAIWNPVDLLLALNNTTVTLLGGATIVIATLSVNVVANIMPACYDLINLMPRRLDFHRSAYLVLFLGLTFMPWLWFTQATSVFALLNIISGLLGPVTGVMLADYFVRRRQLLSLPDLYRRHGLYEGLHGWGVAAILAFLIGGFLAVIGAFVPSLALLNKLSWFVGCGVSFTLYLVFSQGGSIDKRRFLPNAPRVRHEQREYVTE